MTNDHRQVEWQAAYILHSRPYRDSSLLIDCLTPDYGRVSAVVRGGRSQKPAQRARSASLQPLRPLLLSWRGSGDLKTATAVESQGAAISPQGHRLLAVFYLNELLLRLVPKYDQQTLLFARYHQMLLALAQPEPALESLLRHFELDMLELLGYGLSLHETADDGVPIEAQQRYWFDADHCQLYTAHDHHNQRQCFSGELLIALRERRFEAALMPSAKRFCRLAITSHIGDKPLKSRELFK